MTRIGYVAIGLGCVASGLASGGMIDIPGVGPASFELWEARQTPLSAEDRTVYACDFSDGGDWIPSDAKGSTRSCVRLDDGGRRYVRLGGEGRNGFPNGVRSRNRVPVRRGETLKLSFDGRRIDAEGSFVIYLRAYDASGKDVSDAVEFGERWAYSPHSKAFYNRPTKSGVAGKWTRRECQVVVPDGVAAIVPYVCPWRGEHVDCADLRITRSPCAAVRRLGLCARTSGDGRLELDGKDDSILLSASISTGTDGVSRIEAEVRDLSSPPRPRALQVVLAVERDLAGWTWHRNWRADAAVDASACLHDVEMLGGHRVSRYPFTAVSRDGRGIAIGTPFDAPVFEGRETTARGIRSTTIIGLLPRGNGIGTSARLRWIAFPFTGGWGFRSAAKAYYAANDGLVPRPRPGEKEGTWLWPVSPHSGPENPDDFGLTYWEAPTSVGARTNLVAAAHKLGVGVYPYTEAWGMRQPLKTLPDGGHPPVEERFAELSAWAKEDGTKESWFNAPRNVAAQAALNSLPVAPDGTHPYSEDKYGRWSHWWRTNADPRIGRPNRASLCWDYAAGKGIDIVDGVYLDSVSYGFACNFRNVRPEHLAVMDETLVYDSETGVPCADGIQHQVAFVSWLSRELHARGKRVFGNVFGIAHRFNATTVDIFGSEIGGWGVRHEKTGARTHMAIKDESAGERRFYACHRPVSNLLQEGNFSTPARELTAEEVRRYVELQMFYGFYPGISTIGGETEPGYNNWRRYFDKTRACERDRQLFKAAIPLIRRLNRAGWMPEPLMRSGNSRVWVERYGDAAAGDCLFTVRNNSASAVSTTLSAEVAVTLEAAWNGTGLEARPDGSWSVALQPWETAVFLARAKR